MKRVVKKRRLHPGEKLPPTVLRLKDKLQIFGTLALFAFAVGGGIWLHHAQRHAPFQKRYDLDFAQMAQVNMLEKEHERIYPKLKKLAEERRQKLEALLATNGKPSAASAVLLAETNALREDLWTEELRYCRAIAAQMKPASAQRYLAPVEKKFANRKLDTSGYLNIPHP